MCSTIFYKVQNLLIYSIRKANYSFRMRTADEQYKQGFFDELQAFRERVQKRAKEKVEDAIKKYEEVNFLLKKKTNKQKYLFSFKNNK